MGRTITSPVKGWEGNIVLFDPLTLPQAIALEDAISETQKLIEAELQEAGFKSLDAAIKKGFRFSILKHNQALWPALCGCIEKWEIDAFPKPAYDAFPATPKVRSSDFMLWLYSEVMKLFEEPEEIKNE